MVLSLLFFSPVAKKKLRIMDDQGVQKQMAEMYSERFKSTFDESCVNRGTAREGARQ